DASRRVNRAAVAIAASLQLRELTLVGERAVRLNVECCEGRAIGDVECLLVRAQNDPVGREIVAVLGDRALWVGVKESAHREIDAAFAVGRQIVENSTNAVQGIALKGRSQSLALRRKLYDRRVQAPFRDEQGALRVHR